LLNLFGLTRNKPFKNNKNKIKGFRIRAFFSFPLLNPPPPQRGRNQSAAIAAAAAAAAAVM